MKFLIFQYASNGLDNNSAIAISNKLSKSNMKVHTDRNEKYCSFVVSENNSSSNGIFKNNEYNSFIAIIGAYWVDDEDNRLSTIEEAHAKIQNDFNSDSWNFNGNYCYVFYDGRKDKLVIEGDMFGIIPIYYTNTSDGLAISTELKYLTGISANQVDLNALSEYLRFGYMVSNRTLLNNIKRLLPGERLIYQNNLLKKTRIQYPHFDRNTPLSDEILSELDEAFLQYLNRYKNSWPSMQLSLSGGLDSRIICYAAAKSGVELECISFGNTASLEAKIAKKVSDQLNLPFNQYEYSGKFLPQWYHRYVWLTEGRCPPEHFHFIKGMISGVSKEIPMLHGLIGDAVIGGDFDEKIEEGNIDFIINKFRKTMGSFLYWPNGSLENTLQEDILKKYSCKGEEILEELLDRTCFNGSYSDFLWLRYNFRVFGFTIPCLSSQVLPWNEIVTPYLGKKFFTICAKLNVESIVNRAAQVKWALKCYQQLGEIPRIKDGIMIDIKNDSGDGYENGLRILRLKKQIKYYLCRLSMGKINMASNASYPHYGQLIRLDSKIAAFTKDLLLSKKTLSRGFWKKEGIEKLLEDQLKGRNVWGALSTIMLIETFIRQFIENEEIPTH